MGHEGRVHLLEGSDDIPLLVRCLVGGEGALPAPHPRRMLVGQSAPPPPP
jgi:hypothetical protein